MNVPPCGSVDPALPDGRSIRPRFYIVNASAERCEAVHTKRSAIQRTSGSHRIREVARWPRTSSLPAVPLVLWYRVRLKRYWCALSYRWPIRASPDSVAGAGGAAEADGTTVSAPLDGPARLGVLGATFTVLLAVGGGPATEGATVRTPFGGSAGVSTLESR